MAYRIAYKVDPGTAAEDAINAALANGSLIGPPIPKPATGKRAGLLK
jgi:hypothetical protein